MNTDWLIFSFIQFAIVTAATLVCIRKPSCPRITCYLVALGSACFAGSIIVMQFSTVLDIFHFSNTSVRPEERLMEVIIYTIAPLVLFAFALEIVGLVSWFFKSKQQVENAWVIPVVLVAPLLVQLIYLAVCLFAPRYA